MKNLEAVTLLNEKASKLDDDLKNKGFSESDRAYLTGKLLGYIEAIDLLRGKK